ncbi:hypothetical protein F5Y11DRAFT_325488 [Daldinia sp. FL1419]|nr:hypothetical protein F5Y11DRAFT_325488 [Daldinia sp. FL1419]
MPEHPGGNMGRRHNGLRDRTNRPQQNYHYNSPRSGPRQTKVRSDPWQSVNALQLGLHPRPFQELHNERMYLIQMLEQYNRQALDLFRRVPVVDEQIQNASTPHDHRRAKKARGWLRHRITDTVEEEKNVLTRLSELHVEIQSQDRWWQVENEREARGLPRQHPNPNYHHVTASPISPYHTPSPAPFHTEYSIPYSYIVPQWRFFPAYWSPSGSYRESHNSHSPSAPKAHGLPETFEMEGDLTDGALADSSSSGSEDSERSLDLDSEQLRMDTPSSPGRHRPEQGRTRNNSAWF